MSLVRDSRIRRVLHTLKSKKLVYLAGPGRKLGWTLVGASGCKTLENLVNLQLRPRRRETSAGARARCSYSPSSRPELF